MTPILDASGRVVAYVEYNLPRVELPTQYCKHGVLCSMCRRDAVVPKH